MSGEKQFEERCAKTKEIIGNMFSDGSILHLKFLDEGAKGGVFAGCCIIEKKLTEARYKPAIIEALKPYDISYGGIFNIQDHAEYIIPLFVEPLYSFYDMEALLEDADCAVGLLPCIPYKSDTINQIISAIWHVISGKARKYDLARFQQEAFEVYCSSLYHLALKLGDFTAFEYDWTEFDAEVEKIDMSKHTDDIIGYCEFDLLCFLQESIEGQYLKYVDEWALDALNGPGCFGGNQIENFKVKRSRLCIDQDVQGHIDVVIENVLYDKLPEHVYDAYASPNREAAYSIRLDCNWLKDDIRKGQAYSRTVL